MKKNVLSFAVGAALVVSAAQVQSDELLFPYFKTGSGVYSFLSLQSSVGGLFNTGDWSSGIIPGIVPFNTPDFTANTVHYVWQYDDPVQGTCFHNDLTGSMSDFDLIQQTVDAPAFSTLDLDNDFGDKSFPRYLSVDATEGFLIVANDDPEASFWGQMIIVDTNTGIVTAYKGINDIFNGGLGSGAAGATGSFNTLGLTTHLTHMYSWYPDPLVKTDWHVLVTGTNMARTPAWDGAVNITPVLGGVWNRDEDFNSGVVDREITCYDTIQREDFLSAGGLSHTENGGMYWAFNRPLTNSNNFGVWAKGDDCINNSPPLIIGDATDCRATGTLVVKGESTDALGSPLQTLSEENPWPNIR